MEFLDVHGIHHQIHRHLVGMEINIMKIVNKISKKNLGAVHLLRNAKIVWEFYDMDSEGD